MLDRDSDPRLRAAAPYEHRFYSLLQRELEPARPWLAAALALASIGTTWLSADRRWVSPWGYVGAVVFVLSAHELGHAIAARRHGISLGPPLWIPFPWVGTLGSVPRARGPFKTRRDQFDIALAGPLLGLLASISLLYWGFASEGFVRLAEGEEPRFTGSVLAWMLAQSAPSPAAGYDFAPSHVLVAGRLGVFLSFLSLLPGGVLDGAWLSEAIARRRRRWWVAAATTGALGLTGLLLRDPWWLLYSLVCLTPRRRIPPPLNPFLPLGRLRWGLAAFALVIAVLCSSTPREIFNAS